MKIWRTLEKQLVPPEAEHKLGLRYRIVISEGGGAGGGTSSCRLE